MRSWGRDGRREAGALRGREGSGPSRGEGGQRWARESSARPNLHCLAPAAELLSPILPGSAVQVYCAGPKGSTPAQKALPTSGPQRIALWSLVDLEAFPLEWEREWERAPSVFKMC